ncbi:MAG: glycosyltransferase family 2 protein [Xanthobacteraceae bacterium]
MANAPLFTVFTPTYNRAHTLHRVYDGLRAQSLRDFEWLVVDDGSTDNTATLIADWAKSADFSIRYFKQEHLGKHFAHNLAVREARGQMFVPLDSDDACVPDALERMMYWWNTIPPDQRAEFCGVTGLSIDQHGKLVGHRFPSEPLDATLRELRYVHHVMGEKGTCRLTEVLRQYPFPEVAQGQYLPEGIVWLDVAKRFKSRAVNEIFRIYYIDDTEPGVTENRKKNLGAHALGRWHFYIWLLNNDLEYFFHSPMPFLKAAVMLPVVTRLADQSFNSTFLRMESNWARVLVLLALPLAGLLYAAHKTRSPNTPKQKQNYLHLR